MRSALIAAAFLLLMLFDGALFQEDSIIQGRMNIKSKTGELKGWLKKDLLQPNRVNVYDRYGNMRGFWVRDTLSPDTWVFNKK
jgi:hypothetical protein